MKKSFKLKFDDEKDKEEVSIEDRDTQEEPEKQETPAEKPQTEVPRPHRISPPEPEKESSVDKDTVEVSNEDAFRVGKIVVFSILGLIVLIAIISTLGKSPKQTAEKDEVDSENTTQTVFEQKKVKETQQLITSAQKYTVKAGETLYGIAIRLDMDWQDIAKLNDIEPPYTLRTGQELLIPEDIELETEELEEE